MKLFLTFLFVVASTEVWPKVGALPQWMSALIPSNIVRQYDAINARLDEKLSLEATPVEALILTLEWLKQAASGKCDDLDTKALIQFTSLFKLLVPNNFHCDLLGYNILRLNVEAANENIMVDDEKLGPLRRIDTVIREIAVEHAEQCRYEYPKMFKWSREGTNKVQVYQDLQDMLNAVIETSSRQVFKNIRITDPDKRVVLRDKAQGIEDLRGKRQAYAILMFLRDKVEEEQDSRYLAVIGDPKRRDRWTVNEAKVKDIFYRYVQIKCEFLVKSSAHIFTPAAYDQLLYAESRKYRAIDDDTAEFMIWLEYHKLCKRIIDDDREILIKNIIQTIWDLINY